MFKSNNLNNQLKTVSIQQLVSFRIIFICFYIINMCPEIAQIIHTYIYAIVMHDVFFTKVLLNFDLIGLKFQNSILEFILNEWAADNFISV